MATDIGNAVAAEWVGPAGFQLFDGTVLNPGTVIDSIGKDEAESSDYWKVLGDSDSYKGDIASNASVMRDDWSFGAEDGGGATGRPLTDDQEAALKASKGKGKTAASSDATTGTDQPADSSEAAA